MGRFPWVPRKGSRAFSADCTNIAPQLEHFMERVVSGIQQVGIGVSNADEAFVWYKNIFGFDVQVFAEAAEAKLMTRYTFGQVHSRYAILALNMQGGGGLEIWQYKSRQPQPAAQPLVWGQPGILSIKIRCKDVAAFYTEVKSKGVKLLSAPAKNPEGKQHFYLCDPYGNIFEIIEDDYWFVEEGKLTGGVCGVSIGVSNLQQSLAYYKKILPLQESSHQESVPAADFAGLPTIGQHYGRAILHTPQGALAGAFSRLLGPFSIELVQANPALTENYFKGRYWGDLGYIHLCFDIKGYPAHHEICKNSGYPLTIDSGDFAMGDAAGRFSYNEDPDGTWLEYVETYKVPILKKIGWYFQLQKRNARKPLPNWMVKTLRFSKVK